MSSCCVQPQAPRCSESSPGLRPSPISSLAEVYPVHRLGNTVTQMARLECPPGQLPGFFQSKIPSNCFSNQTESRMVAWSTREGGGARASHTRAPPPSLGCAGSLSFKDSRRTRSPIGRRRRSLACRAARARGSRALQRACSPGCSRDARSFCRHFSLRSCALSRFTPAAGRMASLLHRDADKFSLSLALSLSLSLSLARSRVFCAARGRALSRCAFRANRAPTGPLSLPGLDDSFYEKLDRLRISSPKVLPRHRMCFLCRICSPYGSDLWGDSPSVLAVLFLALGSWLSSASNP